MTRYTDPTRTAFVLVAVLAALIGAAESPFFEVSVVEQKNSQPIHVSLAVPLKVRSRVRFHGQLTSGEVCFVVDGPLSATSCIENHSGTPFAPVLTRDYTLTVPGTYDFYALVGKEQSNHWKLIIQENEQ